MFLAAFITKIEFYSDVNPTREGITNNPESPNDDGYETGVAANGKLSGETGKAPGLPPVAPKPGKGGGGGYHRTKPGHSK